MEDHTIKLSSQEKIYFPDEGITKGQVVQYYKKIAPHMLRHLENRPVMLHRFPEGISRFSFYQKDVSGHFPDWIDTVKVEKKKGHNNMVVINDPATLVYLSNQGAITFHTWMSQCNKYHAPDKIVFDLDPPDDEDFDLVKRGANALFNFLENKLGLKTYLMTSGSKGLHIVVPIKENTGFEEVKHFSRTVAEHVAAENDTYFTTEIRKDKRNGRLFLDYLRNDYQQTSVCAYSLRAKKEAPVATPLFWNELPKIKAANQYKITNIFRRMGQIKCCPWEQFHQNAGDIKVAGKEI